MILNLQGISFDTPSPSFFRAVLPYDSAGTIDISYLGARNQWCLFLQHNGEVSTRCFASRDEAVKMVAAAFQKEGII